MMQTSVHGLHKRWGLLLVMLIVLSLLIAVTMSGHFSFARVARVHAAAVVPATTPTLPQVRITSPANNSIYSFKASIPITATVSDPYITIAKVEFYSGTKLIGTVTSAPYSIAWIAGQPGSYTLTAKAYDNYGDVGTSAPITVLAAVQDPPPPPVVTITSPANNAAYSNKAAIPITASVSAPYATISKVEFYNGTTLIGTVTTAPYSFTWAASARQLSNSYTLTAKAYDNYGGIGTSVAVTVLIFIQDPLPPPVVNLTSPASGASFTAPATVQITANVTDTGSSVSKVDFYSGTTLLGTVTSAPYSFSWSNVPAGTYALTAVATDANSSVQGFSHAVTITVGSSAPSCKVNYQLSSQWSGGFSANVVITNTGTTTLNGWTLKFTFPGDQKITNLWNGSFTQSGEQVTVTNMNWNGTIVPNGNVSLGFIGVWTSNDTNPAAFTLNGQICS